MMQFNPFLISGYVSEEYFCNRTTETSNLISFVKNKNNVTIVSPRRMGKTGLILHTFEKLKKEKYGETLYLDIFASQNLEDFIKQLSEAILRQFPEKTPIGKLFWEFIKNLRPLFGFDQITGTPTVQIVYQTESEKQQTLRNILRFLEQQNKTIIIAIDEFQQITEYPEKNIEALLRTEIQHLRNLSFIFCGSKHKIMIDMFSDNKRPFYASTSLMYLNKIDKKEYGEFIRNTFERKKYIIDDESIEFILKWSQAYTYFTQFLCNQIYVAGFKKITVDVVRNVIKKVLEQNTPIFIQLRELLTTPQWNYLIAVAKEGAVDKITAQNFLMKYNIGTASNSTRLMKTLCDRELILENISLEKKEYQIYDVFFLHWLRDNY